MVTRRDDRSFKSKASSLTDSTRRYLVTSRDILRFSHSIDADWVEREMLSNGEAAAPPLFCQTMAFAESSLQSLSRDGTPSEVNVFGEDKKVVGVASEYHIVRRLNHGEIIRVKTSLVDVLAKKGRSGDLIFVMVDSEFEDEAHLCVARERATYLHRP